MTLLPELTTRLFEGREDSRYWIGIVARSDGEILLPEEYRAWRRLRAVSFIDRRGYLPDGARSSDGQEVDDFDGRSEQLVVLQNLGEGRAVAIAGHRLIDRRLGPLPCERIFPEAFADVARDAPVMERSRVISEVDDPSAFRATTRAAYLAAAANGTTHYYAMVEPWMFKHQKSLGQVGEQVGRERRIEKFNSTNLLVRLDPVATIRQVTAERADYPLSPWFRAAASSGSDGLGYSLGESLIELAP
jgi:N-acyl-L-homoserine lactone synthetase